MRKKLYTTFAAIHLGSEMLSMQITEYHDVEKYRVIDSCYRRINIGEDTYKNKAIAFEKVNEICELLLGYKHLMESYGVEKYKLQATTAVREASNRMFLLDQIYSRTGLVVDLPDMPQEIYTKYISIRNTLRKDGITGEDSMLMLDISSGGLGITFVQGDEIKYQENLHVGIIRIRESFERNKRESNAFNAVLTEYITSTISPVRKELSQRKARYLVLSGSETELVLRIIGLDTKEMLQRISASEIRSLFAKVRKMNLPQLMQNFKLPEGDAELILPAIILYEELLALQPVEEVIFTNDKFIDGMLLRQIGMKTSPELRARWEAELISVFHFLGQRYGYDKKHSEQVERLSLIIFDKIAKNYGMGDRERVLLRGAALLHDVGKYASLRSHAIHSYSLIMASDILGFSEQEKQIMAMAAYYHAYGITPESMQRIPALPNISRLAVVAKLAAIIKVADSLDRSYRQKLKECVVNVRNNTLYIQATYKGDVSLEHWTLDEKSVFFEEVYGLKVVLERVNAR